MLIANNEIQKQLKNDDAQISGAGESKNFVLLKYAITNKDNHQTILKFEVYLHVLCQAFCLHQLHQLRISKNIGIIRQKLLHYLLLQQ